MLSVRTNPENIHDKNTLSIHFDGEKIGYLSRDWAELIAPILDEGGDITNVECRITGGTFLKPYYGVNIAFSVRNIS